MPSVAPTALTAAPEDASLLAERLATRSLLVVSLCAAWCDTCGEFRPAFERVAATMPEATFVWLYIEDDSALAGDIDIENFPSIAVFRDGSAVHFGITEPHEVVVARLLAALASTDRALADVSDEVAQLPALLARHAALVLDA